MNVAKMFEMLAEDENLSLVSDYQWTDTVSVRRVPAGLLVEVTREGGLVVAMTVTANNVVTRVGRLPYLVDHVDLLSYALKRMGRAELYVDALLDGAGDIAGSAEGAKVIADLSSPEDFGPGAYGVYKHRETRRYAERLAKAAARVQKRREDAAYEASRRAVLERLGVAV